MILLDTHALLWWISNPNKLGAAAKKQVQVHSESNELVISSISIWEISLLEQKNRIALEGGAEQWFRKVTSLPEIIIQPLDFAIARLSATLPYPYGDPADRFILATAQSLAIPLITKDKRLHRYTPVETIW